MQLLGDYSQQVAQEGFAIVEGVVDDVVVNRLIASIDRLPEGGSVRRSKLVYGVRNLLEVSPEVAEVAVSAPIRSLVTPVLGDDCFAVRATYFDKVPDANWKVPWHQDTAILVRERIETEGFTAWSEKAGALHVSPPDWVLQGMLAIRLHLDDCFANNGPLRMLAGSHGRRWPLDELDAAKSNHREVVCEVAKRGVLAMRPLLLHASSPSRAPEHRRVVHIEYATSGLPNGLEWRSQLR